MFTWNDQYCILFSVRENLIDVIYIRTNGCRTNSYNGYVVSESGKQNANEYGQYANIQLK